MFIASSNPDSNNKNKKFSVSIRPSILVPLHPVYDTMLSGVDPKVSRREINLDTNGPTQLSEGTDGYKRLY